MHTHHDKKQVGIEVVSVELGFYLAGLGILKISLDLLKVWLPDVLYHLGRRYPPSPFLLEELIKINV